MFTRNHYLWCEHSIMDDMKKEMVFVCVCTHLKFLSGQCESHLVVMYGQVCEADLVQRSAQVVHALLTDSPEVHIPPEKGEALKTQIY